jgi:hypothetical protein
MLVVSLHTRGLIDPFEAPSRLDSSKPEAASPDALKVGVPLRQNLIDLSNDATGMREALLDLP